MSNIPQAEIRASLWKSLLANIGYVCHVWCPAGYWSLLHSELLNSPTCQFCSKKDVCKYDTTTTVVGM